MEINAQKQKVVSKTSNSHLKRSSKLSKTRDKHLARLQDMDPRHLIKLKLQSTTCRKFLISLESSMCKTTLSSKPMNKDQINKAKQSTLLEVELEVDPRDITKQMKVSKNTKRQIQRLYLPTTQGMVEKNRRGIVRDTDRTSLICSNKNPI